MMKNKFKPMKPHIAILMLFCFASFSAQNNFESQWEQLIQYENDGLTKSAADLVDTIYNDALKAENKQQQIKALIHKSKYMLILEEDAQLNIVKQFKTEIKKTNDIVTKRLLEHVLATMYWQYFQQNRYQFYDRTKTTAKLSDDFRTWDLETLFYEIHIYYQRSLKDSALLLKESLEHYKMLLNEVEGSKIYRPTLYDLLCHNALKFYKSSETSITKPTYQFKVDDPAYFSDPILFSYIDMVSKDSTSLQLQALKIYQNLLNAHVINASPYPNIVNNIERLKFVLQHSTLENKEALYLDALQKESNIHKDYALSSFYDYEIAAFYKTQGNRYSSNIYESDLNETHRWKLRDAIELCNAVISKYPESEGAKTCEVLKQQILQPNLTLRAEEFIPNNSASRVLVSYKNLKHLDFSIYKVTKKQLEGFYKGYSAEDKLKFFKKLKAEITFSNTLKSEGDYQEHRTEIVVPPLNNGLYIIKADTNSDENVFATQYIQVTDLALIESDENDKVHYQLINRNNGAPISGASIKLTYRTNRNKFLTKNLVTDNFGKFVFNKNTNYYRSVEINVNHKDNIAFFGDYSIGRRYKQPKNDDTKYTTFLFTDRSIYRPGQTVYFKGIVTQTKNNKTTIVENETITTTLYNVNREQVAKLQLTTNTFGSFQGEFILPNDGLTGLFHISNSVKNHTNTGRSYFSVEEYKRPKFKSEFQPISETFKINDSITVKGMATAFAGSSISNAKVVYRVKRKVQYPNWWYWRHPSFYNSEAQEIAFGESITDASGNFEITFKALPDESVSKENMPIFTYEVTADVTDINGETRSTSTIVKVGYHAMTLNIVAPEKIDKSEKDIEFLLVSKNLNGEDISAKGTLKIYKLNAPNQVLRTRPWNAPDYQMISETEFNHLFPNDPYNNEHLLNNWTKDKAIFSTDFDTEKKETITIKKLKKWDSGKYLIIAESKDAFGQNVKAETYASIYSTNDKTVADKQLFEATLDKDSYTIGDLAQLTIGSAAKNITLTVEIEKDRKIISTQIIQLHNSKQAVSIPISDTDIGGFTAHVSFAAFNSYISKSFSINVPYPKTDLDIETNTFRDKLQPGQQETWSFKIKGPKGDKVTAELLASMYDASLDEFKSHSWNFNPISRPTYSGSLYKNSRNSFGHRNFRVFNRFKSAAYLNPQQYDELNWFGLYFGDNYNLRFKNELRLRGASLPMMFVEDSAELEEVVVTAYRVETKNTLVGSAVVEVNEDDKWTTKNSDESFGLKESNSKSSNIQIRKNLSETAFFFPQLQTDTQGNVSFNFKAPEALTQWKLQLLAHTKTLETAVTQLKAVTQKELMVIPNAPRFLREGDQISISTKIANLADKALSGTAQLKLTNVLTGEDISNQLLVSSRASDTKSTVVTSTTLNNQNTSDTLTTSRNLSDQTSVFKTFSVDAKGNTKVTWNLSVPEGLQAVQYKIIAKAGNYSDGEQNALPVLSNRMLVTETLPIWVRSNQTKTFTLDKLASTSLSDANTTLKHHKLTLEMTSNPAWYAVQALPYLMEYPYDCNEQTFSRYYANALAQHIVTSNPKIEAVFNQWASAHSGNKEALLSNLEKNQDLKSLLIQETPWLRDAQSETEQKKRMALLFDLNTMNNELNSALRKLKNNQLPSGAWPWFNGGYANRYITQHIIAGFGHLRKLNVASTTPSASSVEMQMITNAIQYLDAEFVEEYKALKKYNSKVDLSKDHLSHMQLHYLYVRSFFPEIKRSKKVAEITEYYKNQIETYWLKRPLYAKGLMALTMYRMSSTETAGKILRSLKENSITSEELGMYWKENTNSWHWYQAPIETQALLIEAFSEVGVNALNKVKAKKEATLIVDNLKIWLLKHKQTHQWKTTKATTAAVYALLLQGSSWLDATDMVDIKVGDETISKETLNDVKVEAGTGYYKTTWNGNDIKPEQGKVTVTKTLPTGRQEGEGIAWGALYWQYFEDLDKITPVAIGTETPLKLNKKLFLKTNTAKGEEISEITPDTKLKVGDLVSVRIELRTDRSMEFVHLKDMRAAGFEPINVLSEYKWQDGLGYYESTKDAATHFFIDDLPKGIYVFEYDLRVNNAGHMSNGISTIQSMYAPEFSSHSEGVRVFVN